MAGDETGAPLANVLNTAGFYLNAQAAYAEAEPLYERALAIWEKALGPGHPNVATALNNLAVLYHAQGTYEHAAPLLSARRPSARRRSALITPMSPIVEQPRRAL